MSSLARKPIWSEAPNRPHLEMVEAFRETVPGLLSRIEVLRHVGQRWQEEDGHSIINDILHRGKT